MKYLLISILLATSVQAKQKVIIIDTGLNPDPILSKFVCGEGIIDFTGEGTNDYDGHGTNIAGIITNGLDPNKVCIIPVKFWPRDVNPRKTNKNYLEAMVYAYQHRAYDYLNLSLNGSMPVEFERVALQFITNRGILVAAAAGNSGINLDNNCAAYPACYLGLKNFYVIGSHLPFSNYGKVVTHKFSGNNVCYGSVCRSGTSQSTAQFMNEVLKSRGLK